MQFGFRRGRSTVDAIMAVKARAEEANTGPLRKRKHCVLITLDIQNAFNTVPPEVITSALEDKGIPAYLIGMVSNWLRDRRMIYNGTNGEIIEFEVTKGVPQGSVLGPLLWNVAYDGVLRLSLPRGVTTIGFADDLAVVASDRRAWRVRQHATKAVEVIAEWLQTKSLSLAGEKTEATLLSRRRSDTGSLQGLHIRGHTISLSRTVQYLGITMGANPNETGQVKRATDAARATAQTIGRLLPNTGGPTEGRRRLLACVAVAKLLYAAPAWGAAAVRTKMNRERLAGVTRAAALRITRAYRTVSTEAVHVLASIPPGDLLVEEAAKVNESVTQGGDRNETRREQREETVRRWQTRWQESQKGLWTRTLIGDIEKWTSRKHGKLSYCLTQLLTGHGCFGSFLYKIGKLQTDKCEDCSQDESDTAEHTLVRCSAWNQQRDVLTQALGGLPDPPTLVSKMLLVESTWEAVQQYADSVLSCKDSRQKLRELERKAAYPAREDLHGIGRGCIASVRSAG